jgi:ribonuclease-3
MTAETSILGYRFTDAALLEEALTHPSASGTSDFHYERLEFLGDSVLSLIIAEYLHHNFKEEREGDLAKRKAGLVCRDMLAVISKEQGLDKALILGEGEEQTDGRNNAANLENVLEAIIGAIYLDGGHEAAVNIALPLFIPHAEQMKEPPKDPKTTLQEWAQEKGNALPEYAIIKKDGPAHQPFFTVEVRVDDEVPCTGEGTTKRAAEQAAATSLLEHIHTPSKRT